MFLAPHANSTAAALLRLLAAWLAAIVFVQCLGAAQAIGAGLLHRHRDNGVTASAPHVHHGHAGVERHRHDVTLPGVLPAYPDASVDAAAIALAVALALIALAGARRGRDARRHVLRAAPAWAWRTTVPAALLKPPRRA